MQATTALAAVRILGVDVANLTCALRRVSGGCRGDLVDSARTSTSRGWEKVTLGDGEDTASGDRAALDQIEALDATPRCARRPALTSLSRGRASRLPTAQPGGPVAEFTLPSVLTVQLAAYGQRLQEESAVASQKAAAFLHERVVAKARLDPQWASLADQIETWSQDGQLMVGVRDQEFTSQAFALEYGDEVRPPARCSARSTRTCVRPARSMTSTWTRPSGGKCELPLKAEPDLVEHVGFIFAEEEALKQRFPGSRCRPGPGDGQHQRRRVVPLPRGRAPDPVPLHHHRPAVGRAQLRTVDQHFFQDPRASTCRGSRPTLPPEGWGTGATRSASTSPSGWSGRCRLRSQRPPRPLPHVDLRHRRAPARPFWIDSADDIYRRTDRSASRLPTPGDDGVRHQADLPQDLHDLDAGRDPPGLLRLTPTGSAPTGRCASSSPSSRRSSSTTTSNRSSTGTPTPWRSSPTRSGRRPENTSTLARGHNVPQHT